MPLLVDAYLGDTTHLTTEQHGAYLLLLMTMWKRDGQLPNHDVQLASITRLSLSKWRAMKPVIMDFFVIDGDDLKQKRLSRELRRAKAISDAKAEAGAKGAAKRWQKDGTAISSANGKRDDEPNGNSHGKPIANGSQNPWQTDAPIPIPIPSLSNTAHAQPSEHARETASARAEVGKALKRAGVDPLSFNLDDPRLAALLAQGATPAEFEGLAREAVAKRVRKPWAWVLSVLPERRAEAAAIELASPAQSPATTVSSNAADDTQRYLAEQAAHKGTAPPDDVRAKLAALGAKAAKVSP